MQALVRAPAPAPSVPAPPESPRQADEERNRERNRGYARAYRERKRERNARATHGASKTPLAPPPPKARSHRHLVTGRHDVAVAVLRAVATEAASPVVRVAR